VRSRRTHEVAIVAGTTRKYVSVGAEQRSATPAWIRVALGGPERVQSTAGSLYPACSRPKPCGNYISEEKSQWHHRGSRAALSGGNNAQKVSLAKETLPCSCAKASLAGTACRAVGKHGWEVEALTCKTSRSRG
jgi:hypothetical protein